jgi:hypothetical protein
LYTEAGGRQTEPEQQLTETIRARVTILPFPERAVGPGRSRGALRIQHKNTFGRDDPLVTRDVGRD